LLGKLATVDLDIKKAQSQVTEAKHYQEKAVRGKSEYVWCE